MSLFLGSIFYVVMTSVASAEEVEQPKEENLDQKMEEQIEQEKSLDALFQTEDWNELDARIDKMESASFEEWLMGAHAARELGHLEKAHRRYIKASILRSKAGCPIECFVIQEKTALVTIRGEGALLLDAEAPHYLLRAVDEANKIIAQEQSFSGRLPLGLYSFQEGGILITKTGAEVLTSEQLQESKAKQEEYKRSLPGRIYTILEPWKYTPTTFKARASIHTHYFGSDNADISMQSVWSVGPTAGLVWKKTREEWGLGLEANGYLSFSSRSFLFGLNGNAFGEYALPKGFVQGGLRYDFSLGRIVGVQAREQIGTVTEDALDALAIPGVALSLGMWIGYRYPIRENIDILTRIGFRHDGKRGYFDTDVGAVLDVPF